LTAQQQTAGAAGPAVIASTVPPATLSRRPITAPRVSITPKATAAAMPAAVATPATPTPPGVPVVPDWSIPSVHKGFLVKVWSLDDQAADKVQADWFSHISSKVITKKIGAEALDCFSEEARNEIKDFVSEDLQIEIGQNNHLSIVICQNVNSDSLH